MVLKKMKVIRDDLKVLVEGTATQVHVQRAKVKDLKKLLKDAQGALKNTKERVSQLLYDSVEAYVHHFEKARGPVALIYSHLDLSLLDPFKVVLDGELVDKV